MAAAPVPLSLEERDMIRLLSIFPEEVWLLILDDAQNPAPLQRVSDASPYFRTLLLPRRRVEVLFPPVIQILMKRQAQLVSPVPLRQVCSSWRKGVDDALQEDNQKCFHLLHCEQVERRPLVNSTRFEKAEDFTEFERHFDPTHLAAQRNPFLGRRGIVLIFTGEAPYFRACVAFLEKYGPHVWHFVSEIRIVDTAEQQEFYSVGLPRVLGLMPNLRFLEMIDQTERHPGLERSLRNTAFPFLPQLRKLELHSELQSLHRGLVARNPQIRTAEGKTSVLFNAYLQQLPHMTRIFVALRNQRTLQEFCDTTVNCPQLHTLHLEAAFGVRWWGKLFRGLETHFSQNLTNLYLRSNNTSEQGLRVLGERGEGLNLPKLKRLAVQLHTPVPLDFTLPLKNTLERLEICVLETLFPYGGVSVDVAEAHLEQEECGARLKVYQFWKKPRQSNAWVLFPKLKSLRIRMRIQRQRWA